MHLEMCFPARFRGSIPARGKKKKGSYLGPTRLVGCSSPTLCPDLVGVSPPKKEKKKEKQKIFATRGRKGGKDKLTMKDLKMNIAKGIPRGWFVCVLSVTKWNMTLKKTGSTLSSSQRMYLLQICAADAECASRAAARGTARRAVNVLTSRQNFPEPLPGTGQGGNWWTDQWVWEPMENPGFRTHVPQSAPISRACAGCFLGGQNSGDFLNSIFGVSSHSGEWVLGSNYVRKHLCLHV